MVDQKLDTVILPGIKLKGVKLAETNLKAAANLKDMEREMNLLVPVATLLVTLDRAMSDFSKSKTKR